MWCLCSAWDSCECCEQLQVKERFEPRLTKITHSITIVSIIRLSSLVQFANSSNATCKCYLPCLNFRKRTAYS